MIYNFGRQSEASIASLHHNCQLSFERLSNLLGDNGISEGFRNDRGRYRVWAGNAGAHRIGRVSLDHRLREAPNMKHMVIELLADLNQALNDAIGIGSGETPLHGCESYSSDSSDSSLEKEPTSGKPNPSDVLESCVQDINHIITCLYKFSIAIRNPAPSDKLQKCSKIDVSYFEYFDQQHVVAKFPDAAVFLIERLGRANTRRRQLLKYYERHHKKIAAHYELRPSNKSAADDLRRSPEVVAGAEGEQGEPSQYPRGNENLDISIKAPDTIADTTTITDTTVSTVYVPGEKDNTYLRSYTSRSQTSYNPSEASGPEILRVPPLPNRDIHEPFECPYCYSIITVTGEASWARHVFEDVKPYVCTFKDCPKKNHLFGSRHEWFEHEQEIHRKEPYCKSCNEIFVSSSDFRMHLRQAHPGLQTSMSRCERIIQSEQPCPLCPANYLPGRLQRHLGRHMQQIALFVLRPSQNEAKDSNSNGAQIDDSDNENRGSGVGSELDFDSNPPESARGDLDEETEYERAGNEGTGLELPAVTNDDKQAKQGESNYNVTPAEEPRSETEKLRDEVFVMKRRFGPWDPRTLASMETLAGSFYSQRRLREAEELYVQVLSGRRRIFGENDVATIVCMDTLASTLAKQRRWSEAERLWVEVLEKWKRVLGEEDPATLRSMYNLASVIKKQRRWGEAEKLFRQVLEKKCSAFGEDHPDTMMGMHNLASTFYGQQRWSEAAQLYGHVLEKRKRILGEDHSDTLLSMHYLASTFYKQERWSKAEELNTRVLERRIRILGEDHLDTLLSMNDLASTFCKLGRWSEAEELNTRVLEKRKRILGENHLDTLWCRNNIAFIVKSRGRVDEAIMEMTELVALSSHILGADHPFTKDLTTNLAEWKDEVKLVPGVVEGNQD